MSGLAYNSVTGNRAVSARLELTCAPSILHGAHGNPFGGLVVIWTPRCGANNIAEGLQTLHRKPKNKLLKTACFGFQDKSRASDPWQALWACKSIDINRLPHCCHLFDFLFCLRNGRGLGHFLMVSETINRIRTTTANPLSTRTSTLLQSPG